MTTLSAKNSITRPSHWCSFLLIAVTCFALSSSTQAQLPLPTPDGGYLGGNTAEGDQALFNVHISLSNNTGLHNTALGFQALFKDTTGNENTAIGWQALYSNNGVNNTATGYRALNVNANGLNNTADGGEALLNNSTGNNNTATGYRALLNTNTGSDNTGNGSEALRYNTGSYNTAIGSQALRSATTNSYGGGNTATGYQALYNNRDGGNNTADGFAALANNVSGWQNTATGYYALVNATGYYNIALGQQSGSKIKTGNYNIDIGNIGDPADGTSITTPATIRIGDNNNQKRTFVAGIYSTTTGNASTTKPVLIDSNGQLGTAPSSERFKRDIRAMDQSSDAILQLKPVTFHYKNDNTNTPEFGLIAEDVEKVDRALVIRDTDGKVDSVRYEAVNAMLLNEFLKEHRKVDDQQTTITELRCELAKQKATIAQQQKAMETLAAGLAKVSAQIDAAKPVTRLVNNRR